MSVLFREFDFDSNVEIARCIYRVGQGASTPTKWSYLSHQVTPLGAVVSKPASEELLAFIQFYAESIGAVDPYFFRLDVYVDNDRLVVLEVNAAFVDGWGTSLNLNRASAIQVDATQLGFPNCFLLFEECYRPELELLISELKLAGAGSDLRICRKLCRDYDAYFPNYYKHFCGGPIYVYGRIRGDGEVLPHDGLNLDSKLHLARFSDNWPGDFVVTPRSYTFENAVWEAIPKDVFLKFTYKGSTASQRAKFSVVRGKPASRPPFLRDCFSSGDLIAQEIVGTHSVELQGKNRRVQLVVLTNGQTLTGYVQYGTGDIINDNSIHGPLLFEH